MVLEANLLWGTSFRSQVFTEQRHDSEWRADFDTDMRNFSAYMLCMINKSCFPLFKFVDDSIVESGHILFSDFRIIICLELWIFHFPKEDSALNHLSGKSRNLSFGTTATGHHSPRGESVSTQYLVVLSYAACIKMVVPRTTPRTIRGRSEA